MAEIKDTQFEKVPAVEGVTPSVEVPFEKSVETFSTESVSVESNPVVDSNIPDTQNIQTPKVEEVSVVDSIELPDSKSSVSDGSTWLGLTNYKVSKRGEEIRE